MSKFNLAPTGLENEYKTIEIGNEKLILNAPINTDSSLFEKDHHVHRKYFNRMPEPITIIYRSGQRVPFPGFIRNNYDQETLEADRYVPGFYVVDEHAHSPALVEYLKKWHDYLLTDKDETLKRIKDKLFTAYIKGSRYSRGPIDNLANRIFRQEDNTKPVQTFQPYRSNVRSTTQDIRNASLSELLTQWSIDAIEGLGRKFSYRDITYIPADDLITGKVLYIEKLDLLIVKGTYEESLDHYHPHSKEYHYYRDPLEYDNRDKVMPPIKILAVANRRRAECIWFAPNQEDIIPIGTVPPSVVGREEGIYLLYNDIGKIRDNVEPSYLFISFDDKAKLASKSIYLTESEAKLDWQKTLEAKAKVLDAESKMMKSKQDMSEQMRKNMESEARAKNIDREFDQNDRKLTMQEKEQEHRHKQDAWGKFSELFEKSGGFKTVSIVLFVGGIWLAGKLFKNQSDLNQLTELLKTIK